MCVVALVCHTKKFLATYFLLQFLHPSVLLDFGAPSPGIPHRACSRCQGGGHSGGLPCTRGGQRLWHGRGGMAEDQMRLPMFLPVVSKAGMSGC